MTPALDVGTWQVGDKVRSLEDNVNGVVIAADSAAVKVQWDDGMVSMIGRRSNVAGRFEVIA